MSVKNHYIFAILFLVGAASTSFFVTKNHTTKKSHGMHSPRPEPMQSIFTSKGVSSRTLKVHLVSDKVKTNNEEAEVTATISMPFNYNSNLSFKWKLGEGVTAIGQTLEGQIINLKAGEEKLVKLKVKGFSLQENHHIGFEIIGILNGRRIHGDSLLASDMENTFENTVQNVERIKSEQ